MNNKLIILEYTNDDVSTVNFTDTVLYDVIGSLQKEGVDFLQNKSALVRLKEKHGDKAFLDPKNLKYPIINPKTGEKDQALLHAAYIDLKRRAGISGTGDLAQKARDMMDENVFLVDLNGNYMPLLEFLDYIE